ncbi:unnamed protein product [Parascedosporium putredinis]|nr:unnamed protein product [Parascedosporium putredinis]CAI8000335.1 unnamed protein product [Parascedosporium putredinis]
MMAQQPPNSSVPLSQIEKSVTHLLVATKQLLETLTQWSRGQATDGQVSDVYVRLGYEFNMACRAFSAINVDTSDLGNVPELLRHILEATLSQEASTESLENYLPRIRDIIINLLHGLKRKQQKLRQKTARDRESGSTGSVGSLPERSTSTNTMSSMGSGLTSMLDDGLSNDYRDSQSSPAKNRLPPQRDDTRGSTNSAMSNNAMQGGGLAAPPYPENGGIPSNTSAPGDFSIDNFPRRLLLRHPLHRNRLRASELSQRSKRWGAGEEGIEALLSVPTCSTSRGSCGASPTHRRASDPEP